jgi:GntR family transcriptional regulator
MITRRVPLRYTKAFREQDGAHGAFEAEIRAAGLTPRVLLNVTVIDGTVFRERIMYADYMPVQVATTMIPASVALLVPGLDREDTGAGGMMSRLAERGFAPVRFTEGIRYRRPEPGTLEANLECGPMEDGCYDPVMEIVHCAYAHDGTLVERTVCVLPCHLWTLEYSWEGEESNGQK